MKVKGIREVVLESLSRSRRMSAREVYARHCFGSPITTKLVLLSLAGDGVIRKVADADTSKRHNMRPSRYFLP